MRSLQTSAQEVAAQAKGLMRPVFYRQELPQRAQMPLVLPVEGSRGSFPSSGKSASRGLQAAARLCGVERPAGLVPLKNKTWVMSA